MNGRRHGTTSFITGTWPATSRALVEAIAEMYFEQGGETYAPSKLDIDLAAQIVTNARITVRKLAFFRYSLLLFGFGVLVASGHGAAARSWILKR